MPQFVRGLVCSLLLAALSGCGSLAQPSVGAWPSPGAQALASALTDEELTLLRELGLRAHLSLAEVSRLYGELKLDTAHGRKITPAREPIVSAALRPLVEELDATSALIDARLVALDTPKLAYLRRELAKRSPDGEGLHDGADVHTLLYRVAQHRLRLGYLLEYAQRKRAIEPNAGAPLI